MPPIQLPSQSSRPKYLQLADAIVAEIENGGLPLNERLPSVNQLSKELKISRETVFKALNYLSEKGIVSSVDRMGYFVQRTDTRLQVRVLLMLDKMNYFKEQLYFAFRDTIGNQGEVDIYFHNHNIRLFRSFILDNLQNYTHFAIVTFMREREETREILNLIPENKRVILDCYESDLEGEYIMVFQDFANDIFHVLEQVSDRLANYKQIVLIKPDALFHFESVLAGIQRFCLQYNYPYTIVPAVTDDFLKTGDLYFTFRVNDREMVDVIEVAQRKNLLIGSDIGIISYNDTPVKEVLEGGITVISTDFTAMGSKAASMLLNRESGVIANPTQLIFRRSL